MAWPLQIAYAIIITISTLVATWALSNDLQNGESLYRERRALVFPPGTVLQVCFKHIRFPVLRDLTLLHTVIYLIYL
jgi:hypothetical protein